MAHNPAALISGSDLRTLLSPDKFSIRDGKPLLSPTKSEEISAIARYANQHSLAFEITGGGSKHSWGNPVDADILLSTASLSGVLSHSWQDLTATIAAGTPWAAMQHALAKHNQFVALDPLWPETATVGGIIATNDSGALRLQYGSLRDLIIGMTIVLADGTVAKSGGKVVKNVAGYDLHKLMTGAFGTLGIITEVSFRLHPLPQHSQSFTAEANDAIGLSPLLSAIRYSNLLADAIQIRLRDERYHLDIQLSAHPDARQSDLLHDLAHTTHVQLAPTAAFPRTAREPLFQDGATVIKTSVLPTQLWDTLQSLKSAEDLEVACVAQASGLIFASFTGSPSAVDRHIESVPSDLTILSGPTSTARWKARPDSLPLMREIKRQFDPNRILNPGRFLGGI